TATWRRTRHPPSCTSRAQSRSTRACRSTARRSSAAWGWRGGGGAEHLRGGPRGASIGVFGGGGVGLNVVQGGALVAAHPVIAVDVKAAKLEHALALGASHGVDASREDPGAAIRRIAPRGADYTFVAVGDT